MLLGYARVSTDQQDASAQHRALYATGCERVFEDQASGGRWNRPELHRLLDQLRGGDVLVVWKLDRLLRSLKDLLHIMEKIEERGAGLRSLTEAVDTTTPAGRMMMQMVGAFAEFERAVIRERTMAGLQAARAEGLVRGRPRKLSTRQREEARMMIASGSKSAAEVARLFNVHASTISRLLAKAAFSKRTTEVPRSSSACPERVVRGRGWRHIYNRPPTTYHLLQIIVARRD